MQAAHRSRNEPRSSPALPHLRGSAGGLIAAHPRIPSEPSVHSRHVTSRPLACTRTRAAHEAWQLRTARLPPRHRAASSLPARAPPAWGPAGPPESEHPLSERPCRVPRVLVAHRSGPGACQRGRLERTLLHRDRSPIGAAGCGPGAVRCRGGRPVSALGRRGEALSLNGGRRA